MTRTPLASPRYQLDGWGGNYEDENGVAWVITEEDGWSGPAPARTQLADRPQDDGGDDAPTYEGSRIITLTGTCVAPTRALQNASKDVLNGVAYRGRGLYPLLVIEEHARRLAFVRRSGTQKVSDTSGISFDFSLSLVAPDPRKYSEDEVTISSALSLATGPDGRTLPWAPPRSYPIATSSAPLTPATNDGNRETGAVITFAGPMTGPSVRHLPSGAELTFDLALDNDDRLEVDLLNRTVVLNGTADRKYSLSTGSAWFLLDPGANPLLFTGLSTGAVSPVMTTRYRHAWK